MVSDKGNLDADIGVRYHNVMNNAHRKTLAAIFQSPAF